jgi:transposase-like protein
MTIKRAGPHFQKSENSPKKAENGTKWVPDEFEGVQVNFCEIPQCRNFGVAKFPPKRPRGRPAQASQNDPRPRYVPTGTQQAPYARCTNCRKKFPLKSNQGVHEELDRLNSYLRENVLPEEDRTCPYSDCSNHGVVSIAAGPDFYMCNGTRDGRQRYLCRACGRTFTLDRKRRKLAHSHLTGRIFTALVNKSGMRNIVRIVGIDPHILYDRIDFIYERCLEFSTDREKVLRDGLDFDRLYISADQQDLAINWPTRLVTAQQLSQLTAMRTDLLSSLSLPTGAYLYSEAIPLPTVENTDFLFEMP